MTFRAVVKKLLNTFEKERLKNPLIFRQSNLGLLCNVFMSMAIGKHFCFSCSVQEAQAENGIIEK